MSSRYANAMLGQAEKLKPDPGTGKAISVNQYMTIVPIVTTTAVPSAVTLTKTATDTALGTSLTLVDRSETVDIVLIGSGGNGASGAAGTGGRGGGGGEYAAWTSQDISGSGSLSHSTIYLYNYTTQAFSELQLGTVDYAVGNGQNGSDGGAGGTGGAAESYGAPTTDNDGGAGGTGHASDGGGGGGEAGSASAAGNAGSNANSSAGAAGGTGTAGADGGAGGGTAVVGTDGTAPGGGGGGGGADVAGGSGAAGSCAITYTPIAETNTLPDPTMGGVYLQLWAKTLVCNRVITATTEFDSTGNNVIALDTADDCVILKSVPNGSGYRWQLVANKGAVLWAA